MGKEKINGSYNNYIGISIRLVNKIFIGFFFHTFLLIGTEG